MRDRTKVEAKEWAHRVDIHVGDLNDATSLEGLGDGVDVAYYLVHSLVSGADFERRDRHAARNFVRAVKGVGRVVYLGGLLPPPHSGRSPSRHLASRAEVGRLLRQYLPTTEIRAGPIIGSGSAAFEMVRYLTERLPTMLLPRWILNQVHPVAIRDVLAYLLEAGIHDDVLGVVEVGSDPITFKAMLEGYARVQRLRRHVFAVPITVPRLAAFWVGLVTPIPIRLAILLVEGVVQPVLADRTRARALFPHIVPIPYETAVRLAVQRIVEGRVDTRWSGALHGGPRYRFEDREGLLKEVRTRGVLAPPEEVFRVFASLGGERGWLVWRPAWKARGLLDQLVGGPGLRRGRRHPSELTVGEAVDFWRVEQVERPWLLRLRAEMKVPGRAWLQWEAVPEGPGTRLVQTAVFQPYGLPGVLYWYALHPVHRFIFTDLVDAVAREAVRHRAERNAGSGAGQSSEPIKTLEIAKKSERHR